MNSFVILLFCAISASVISGSVLEQKEQTQIDFSSIKPLHLIPSYRAAHPRLSKTPLKETSFDSRIVNGQIATPTDVPYQVRIIYYC